MEARAVAWGVLGLVAAVGCAAATPEPRGGEPVATGSVSAPATSSSGAPVPRDRPFDHDELELEKTPFTADQIRDATAPGRTYTFRVELDGAPAVRRIIRFTAMTADGATVVTESADAEGRAPQADPPVQMTWEQLRQHAEFPRFAVRITEERVEVPAGAYDCLVYTVTAAEEKVTFAFAKTMPGPPVKMLIEKGGKIVRKQELLSYAPGKR